MELFHLINRGVDGRNIFMDNQDRARFVHDLFEFNNCISAGTYRQRMFRTNSKKFGRNTSELREKIVDIHGWKLMRNHIHMIVSERKENGMLLFLQKMSGYARYFNERHKRRGHLFEKGTKKILIENDSHFLYILHYIHLNGLDDLPGAKKWRERDHGSMINIESAIEHLRADRWSSFRDYCGIHNFPSILTKTVFDFGTYENDLREYLNSRAYNFPKDDLE